LQQLYTGERVFGPVLPPLYRFCPICRGDFFALFVLPTFSPPPAIFAVFLDLVYLLDGGFLGLYDVEKLGRGRVFYLTVFVTSFTKSFGCFS